MLSISTCTVFKNHKDSLSVGKRDGRQERDERRQKAFEDEAVDQLWFVPFSSTRHKPKRPC